MNEEQTLPVAAAADQWVKNHFIDITKMVESDGVKKAECEM